MSLKAKMEAVIYAAEEPVTLPQLVGLLGLEAQAQLDAADARQGQLQLQGTEDAVVVQEVEAGDQDALNAETLGTEAFAAVPPLDEAGTEIGERGTEAEVEARGDQGESGASGTVADDGVAAEEILSEVAAAAPEEPSPAALRARERRVREYMRELLDELIAEYAKGDRGLEIREVAGGFRFATKPEYHDAVRGFVRSLKPPLKLSLQALETLAVIAYRQPATAPEVSEIRGVDSAGVLGSLITRKLVTTAGRKQVIGRPILYKTTKEFLLRFGLKDLNDLPSIEEFERLAADLTEAVQEEIPMPEQTMGTTVPIGTAAEEGGLSTAEVEQDVEPNRDVHMSQADGDPGDEESAENLTPAPDGPGEFTGDNTVPSADNIAVDGRVSGVPPMYDEPNDELLDSPAHDAAVESEEQKGN